MTGRRVPGSARRDLDDAGDHVTEPQDPIVLDGPFVTDPHGSYAKLNGAAAVHRAVTPDGSPVRLVTGYREVRAATTDPGLSLDKCHAATTGSHGASMPPELDAHLLNTDPPEHTRLRRLVATAFTPRRMEGLRDSVQRVTDDLLGRMAPLGRADIVADLAMPLSMAVICDLLGVPEEDRPDFRGWTNTLNSPAPDAAVRSREAMRSMHGYLTGLVGQKLRKPAGDLLSALVAARDDGDRLNEDELVALAFLLLFGGYNNSATLIATTVLALLTHPEHLAALRMGALGMDAVTEEALRWNSPTMVAVRRFAREDVDLGPMTVRAGERIWLSWGSANRDPDLFASPEVFDPTRADSNGHLAFGHGAHYCPGATLARLENSIAVSALIHRFPALTPSVPAGELRWTESLRVRSLSALPVTF
ncbi:cytochrome P450 [Streptomyces sp. NPDC048639]|uniref:cytochrome P450 family protein n=1 Tax=Streptomyces sp. NPDC048639 TaxID=3365581 RepID=UPI0037116DA1